MHLARHPPVVGAAGGAGDLRGDPERGRSVRRERIWWEVFRRHRGRGTVGKAIVAGARDHASGQISAAVVPDTTKRELQAFATDRVAQEADVFTDESSSYQGLPNHTSVNHGVGEYVKAQVHTNGLESFWSLMKRGYYGTYHRMSPAHLQRYVNESQGATTSAAATPRSRCGCACSSWRGSVCATRIWRWDGDALDTTPYSG